MTEDLFEHERFSDMSFCAAFFTPVAWWSFNVTYIGTFPRRSFPIKCWWKLLDRDNV